MGFRGSRVQIPPSRLSEDQALQRLWLWGFFFACTPCCEFCCESDSAAHNPLRRMQHHSPHRFGIGLLIRTKQRLLVLPAPGFHHVTHRVALPLRGPFATYRMPHRPPLAWQPRDLVRLPEPRVEQMPTARLRRVLRRSEDGRISDRTLRPSSCHERFLHGLRHRDDLLKSRLVRLGAPADGVVLKVHVIPPQVAPRRDTPSRSLGHYSRELKQRVNLIRYFYQPEIDIVQHHRPLRILLAWGPITKKKIFLQK